MRRGKMCLGHKRGWDERSEVMDARVLWMVEWRMRYVELGSKIDVIVAW